MIERTNKLENKTLKTNARLQSEADGR